MSPSRLMAIMDPLLNTGFLWRCLAAYAGIKADDEPPHDDLESVTVADLNKSSIQSSPDQMVPDLDDNKQNLKQSEYIRGDKYYSQLGIFKKKQQSPKKHRLFFFDLSGDIMGSRQAHLLRKLRESTLPDNPYMSPLCASDETLRQFPTTYLIVSNFLLLYEYCLVQYFVVRNRRFVF